MDTIDTSWEWGAEGAKPSESLEKEKPKNETEGRLSSNMSEEKKSTKNETDSLTHNRNKPKVETTKSVEENQSSLNSDDFSAKPKEFKPSYKPEQQQHLQQQPQPQQQGGFGWSSWSKLGTNLLSSAATLTSQVIGTVEATLGAPDPEELAAKIAKAEAEQQKDATTADSNQKSSEGGWEFENDNNDWFSMDKIASTVEIFHIRFFSFNIINIILKKKQNNPIKYFWVFDLLRERICLREVWEYWNRLERKHSRSSATRIPI